MDQLGPVAIIVGQPVEEAIKMLGGLGPALRREARRLVEDEAVGVAMDDHLADQLFLLGRQRFARFLRPGTSRSFGLARWNLDGLTRLKAVAFKGR